MDVSLLAYRAARFQSHRGGRWKVAHVGAFCANALCPAATIHNAVRDGCARSRATPATSHSIRLRDVSLSRRLDREAKPVAGKRRGEDAVDFGKVERGQIQRTTGHPSVWLMCATALTMLLCSI